MSVVYNNLLPVDGLQAAFDSTLYSSYPGSGSTWYNMFNIGNISFANQAYNSSNKTIQNNNDENFFYGVLSDQTWMQNTFNKTTGAWTIAEHIRVDDLTYPKAAAGMVASGHAYSPATATGFDVNHGNSGTYVIRISGSSSKPRSNTSYHFDGSLTFSSMPNRPELGDWYLRTLTWDRDANRVYGWINATYIGEVDMGANVPGYTLYDGGGISFGTLYGWKHDGARSAIYIWNRALTSHEHGLVYNVVKSRG